MTGEPVFSMGQLKVCMGAVDLKKIALEVHKLLGGYQEGELNSNTWEAVV